MRIEDFFTLVNIRIKKLLHEVRKKWKTNVWNLELGQELVKLFVFKHVIALEEVIFFCKYNENIRKGKFIKLIWNIFGKTRLLRKKKVRLKSLFEWKNGKIISYENWVLELDEVNIFPVKTKRCAKISSSIQSESN